MANEKRLIDANAYKKSIMLWKMDCIGHDDYESASVIDDCMCELDSMPTVDAVVVARCRDCINYNTMGCSNGFGWCEAWQQGRADESFCDCGERKDNG